MQAPAALPTAPITLPRLQHAPTVSWRVPGSKSLTNRAFVLAALANGTTRLTDILRSDDTEHMQRCLRQLGIESTDIDATTVDVHGGRQHLTAPDEPLFVGNSGTTVRFLTALAALVPGEVTLIGDQHMAQRPIGDLLTVFDQLGISYTCATGAPPLTIHGGTLPGGTVHLRGDRSSQYLSALLMAAAGADDSLEIIIDGTLVSEPYVAMTQSMINSQGGTVTRTKDGYHIAPATYHAETINIEPDASAASYPWALAAASGGSITVPGLNANSLQGDVHFTEVLQKIGATTDVQQQAITVDGSSIDYQKKDALEFNMHHISDTVMSLAAIAPVLGRHIRIVDIANIRIKETDRLQALVNELSKLGQGVTSGNDWLEITPQPIQPAAIECYADHRMAMSFAILGLATGQVTITDPACVSKTYPGFWHDLRAICTAGQTQATW